MTNVIELEQLSVTFGKRPILKSLSGALDGRAIGLLGPNGAGKTSLIHTLLGFHPPTSGTARIFGQDITTDAKQCERLSVICRRAIRLSLKCRASTSCV
jgi:ABC-2 type transport system ATP-binding protein